MMLDRMEGNAELKTSVQQMLATRRLTHSVLLVGEAGLGTGFAARCIAADYLYPAGGAAAEALLRGECCRAVAKAGKRDSGTVETGIVREAISVSGMGSGGKYLVGQVTAMRSEIFNTSLSAEGRAVLLYHVERMNEDSLKTQLFQASDIALIFIHHPVLHILNKQNKLRCFLAKQQTPVRPSFGCGQIAPLIFIQTSFQDRIF